MQPVRTKNREEKTRPLLVDALASLDEFRSDWVRILRGFFRTFRTRRLEGSLRLRNRWAASRAAGRLCWWQMTTRVEAMERYRPMEMRTKRPSFT
jgi:hypothetical protein